MNIITTKLDRSKPLPISQSHRSFFWVIPSPSTYQPLPYKILAVPKRGSVFGNTLVLVGNTKFSSHACKLINAATMYALTTSLPEIQFPVALQFLA